MENENKKKSSSFKTVCAVLGCVVMAVVYISGGIYAVERLKETEFYQEAVAKTKLLQEQGANSEEAKANNAKAEESKPEDSFGKMPWKSRSKMTMLFLHLHSRNRRSR